MAVVNVTPDSFSDGGRFASAASAVEAGRRCFAAGADVVDVGGESTRPGARPVDLDEELRRVMPVIEGLGAAGFTGISIDTTKAEVARRATRAGARIVNDISGLDFDPALAEATAESGAHLILGHTRGPPPTMQQGTIDYPGGVVSAVRAHLARALERARAAGVPADRLWVDPGFGFGKTVAHNLELLRHLSAFAELAPVVVGTSRKRFLGELTGRPVHERSFATAATVALAIRAGAAMVRVHDVPEMVDVVRVADAVVRGPG